MGGITHLDEIYDSAYEMLERAIQDTETVISDPEESTWDLESLVINQLVTTRAIALTWQHHTLVEMVSHIQFKQRVQSLLALGDSKDTHEAQAAVRLVDSQRDDLSNAATERIGRREKMSAAHEELWANLHLDHEAQGGSRDAAAVNSYWGKVQKEVEQARNVEGKGQTQQEGFRRLARQSVLDGLSNRNRSVASAAAATVAAGSAGSLRDRDATASLTARFASHVRSARRAM